MHLLYHEKANSGYDHIATLTKIDEEVNFKESSGLHAENIIGMFSKTGETLFHSISVTDDIDKSLNICHKRSQKPPGMH